MQLNLWLGFKEGVREILAHKFRSFLTMFGIILGVASLMAMFALTAGMAAGFREALTQSGDIDKVRILVQSLPPAQAYLADMSTGLTYRDALALRKPSPFTTWVSPFIVIEGARVTAMGRGFNTRLYGAENELLTMDKHIVASGRFLTDLDYQQKAMVVVLGYTPASELFGDPEKALGRTVALNGVNFRVVGVFEQYLTQALKKEKELGITAERDKRRAERGGRQRRGQRWDPLGWKNNSSAIPLTTMLAVFRSATVVNEVDGGPDPKLTEIQVGLKNPALLDDAVSEIRNRLLVMHRGLEDFFVQTSAEGARQINAQVRATQFSGGIIAGISLLVGGLGIANIMLASITDRIRELGIRLAVGARPLDIFVQMMIEAVVISLAGAILGLIASYGLMQFLEFLAPVQNQPIIEPLAIVISLTFALITGILAGLYPAIKAASLTPLQALKFD